MLFVDLFGWWYSRGWKWASKYLFGVRSRRIIEFFSMLDLLKTLFAPFRQDTVDTRGSLSLKLQAFGNNIVSRCFGFLLRLCLLLCGSVILLLNSVVSGICVVVWPFVPLTPVLVIILLLTGVGRV